MYNKLSGKKILWLASSPDMIMQFYLPQLAYMQKSGAKIMLASCFQKNIASKKILTNMGVMVYDIDIKRGGKNIFQEAKTLFLLWRLVRQIKPDMINAIALKMVLYGGVVARLNSIKLLGNITGLGFVFISKGLFAVMVRGVLRLVLPVLFQADDKKLLVMNNDDYDLLHKKFFLKKQNLALVFGVGVDSDYFRPMEKKPKPPQGKKTIITIARLLADKGVIEFCQAVSILRLKHYDDNFFIYGGRDDENPTALSLQKIKWLKTSGVKFMGHIADVRQAIKNSDAVALFSYREGMPQVLLEAAAMEKPLLACDVAGSRDICKHHISGLLIKHHQPASLAMAMEKILCDDGLRKKLGYGARQLVLKKFSQTIIKKQMLALWGGFF
ncbi:MAG: glycosyltransferase family 4 protein [Alphaproteobacteria bacterium]